MRLTIVFLTVLSFFTSHGYATAEQHPKCGPHGAQQKCLCNIEAIRPTQVAVGWLHVQEILEKGTDKLKKHNEEKPTQVVLGPDGQLYVTDGHHHARAWLEELRKGTVEASTICSIIEDDTTNPSADRSSFLKWLADRRKARLNGGDEVNGEVRPDLYPPERLGDMTNDSYRSLASFMGDGCKFEMTGDFGQFPLADLLRRAKVTAPTQLEHHKKQGRKAAVELVNKISGNDELKSVFSKLPYRDDIGNCASGKTNTSSDD